MKRLKELVLIPAILLSMAACDDSNASYGDLTGVPAAKPDKIRAYNNVDGHPNIVELCIGQRAFLTTSRTAGNNFMRFPEDDIAFCGAKSESKYLPQVPSNTDAQPNPASS